jgi:hypothetical protein
MDKAKFWVDRLDEKIIVVIDMTVLDSAGCM